MDFRNHDLGRKFGKHGLGRNKNKIIFKGSHGLGREFSYFVFSYMVLNILAHIFWLKHILGVKIGLVHGG